MELMCFLSIQNLEDYAPYMIDFTSYNLNDADDFDSYNVPRISLSGSITVSRLWKSRGFLVINAIDWPSWESWMVDSIIEKF